MPPVMQVKDGQGRRTHGGRATGSDRSEGKMDDVEKLLKGMVEELDRLLNARNVLGDPIERDGATIVPIVSFGFAFGAGGGTGGKPGAPGSGAGTGGGGGIRPLGAIIIDEKGARVEAVKGTLASVAGVLGEAAYKVATQRGTGGKAGPEKA